AKLCFQPRQFGERFLRTLPFCIGALFFCLLEGKNKPSLIIVKTRKRTFMLEVFPGPRAKPQAEFLAPQPSLFVRLNIPITPGLAESPTFQMLCVWVVAEILMRVKRAFVNALLGG